MPKETQINELGNPSKEYVFRSKRKKLFKKLRGKTHFSYEDIESLAIIYNEIRRTLGPIYISKLQDILHSGFDFTENKRHFLIDKIFEVIDTTFSSKIKLEEWIKGLSIMLNGTLKEKCSFAYKTYDWFRTNKLTKEQLFPIMRGCVIKQQPDENLDESVLDMIELLIKKIDVNRSGDISAAEYEEVVTINPFYLESIGPVFPSRAARYAFLNTFTDKEVLY